MPWQTQPKSFRWRQKLGSDSEYLANQIYLSFTPSHDPARPLTLSHNTPAHAFAAATIL